MASFLLEPEFVLDLDSTIKNGPLLVENGIVTGIGSVKSGLPLIKLKNQVLMPGFVNGHSHSFQRALRGTVETFLGSDDFWSWRSNMYALANSLSPDEFSLLSRLCFLEMLEAGFTHVGEFHYLHHDVGGKSYQDPLIMSKILMDAAKDTRINLCLLEAAYNRYNFSEPLKPEQARFGHQRLDSFLALVKDALNLKSPNHSLGVAIHSVRSVPSEWFSAINDLALAHKMPLHIHVSEQMREVRDCQKHCGHSPIKLLAKNHLLSPHITLVHATHLIDDDADLIKSSRPNLCICPSTEKNLGDGMLALKNVGNVVICIGTDQHVRFDPFDEVRSLEEQERLRLNIRGALSKKGVHLYETLHPFFTLSGLKSLYPYENHQSLVGAAANLVSMELPPEYYWHGPKIALDAIMLSYHPSNLVNVITNGHFVIQDRQPIGTDKPYLIKNLLPTFKKIFAEEF